MSTILYRMPAGVLGDITRHDFDTEPVLVDTGNPPLSYGIPVLIDPTTQGARPVAASDAGLTGVYGFAARPYPIQQLSGGMSSSLGGGVPPTAQALDVLRRGYMLVLPSGSAAFAKGNPVFVYIGASTGAHVQQGVENAASASVVSAAGGGNTGNGTVSAGPTIVAAKAVNGVYTLTFTAATAFAIVDPNGKQLATGVTGSAYSDGGLGFTITAGGTAFVAGDTFTFTVTLLTIALDSKYTFNGPLGSDVAGNAIVEIAVNV